MTENNACELLSVILIVLIVVFIVWLIGYNIMYNSKHYKDTGCGIEQFKPKGPIDMSVEFCESCGCIDTTKLYVSDNPEKLCWWDNRYLITKMKKKKKKGNK